MGESKTILVGVGSIYVETNYLDTQTAQKDTLELGKEYRSTSYEIRAAGSVANMILQASLLGQEAAIIGKIGADEQGKKLLALLAAQHIRTDFIRVAGDVQTSIDTGVVFAHNGKNIQLVSGNANQTLSADDIDLTDALFKRVQAVYFGGYFKQESLYKSYPALTKQISGKGIKVFLDHGRIPVDVTNDKIEILKQTLPFVEGYFPNESELFSVTGKSSFDEAIHAALGWGPKYVVVKQGEHGCTTATSTDIHHIDGIPITPMSTVGAGDTFNAAFLSQYLNGKDIQTSAIFANKIAAYKVRTNKSPTMAEISSIMGL